LNKDNIFTEPIPKKAKEPPKEPPKIIPNDAKSEEGKWYPFASEFKLEEILKKDDIDYEENHYPCYKLTIKFSDEVRKGIYPKDLVLIGTNQDWGSYYYRGMDEGVENYVIRMANRIKSMKSELARLRSRNHALELHFTKTRFDEDREQLRRDHETENCEYCNESIDKKKLIEGKDWFYLAEEGIMHIECGVKSFGHKCKKCGFVFEYDFDSEGCPECGGHVERATVKEVRNNLTYSAIKKYLPEELRDRVVLKDD